MDIRIEHIGKSADDLRFFILCGGKHAGGITVHSIESDCFSYGIAIAPAMRRRGVARAALSLLFDAMRARGFARAAVQIDCANEASLALHRALGFSPSAQQARVLTMTRTL